jgi:hypothetical protein
MRRYDTAGDPSRVQSLVIAGERYKRESRQVIPPISRVLQHLLLDGALGSFVLKKRLNDVLDINFGTGVIRRAGNDKAVFHE